MLNWLANQFGFSNLAEIALWFFLLEVLGIGALLTWFFRRLLAVFDYVPKSERQYWLAAMPLVVFVLLWSRNARELPKVSINPSEITTSEMADKRSAFMAVTAVVTNTGAPSSVGGYQLIATLPAGQTVIANRVAIPPQGFLMVTNGLRKWFCTADALEHKTATPVPTGGFVFGQLLYVFQNVSKATLESPGVTLELKIVDVWNRVASWDYEVKAGAVEPITSVQNFPGLTPQPSQPTLAAPPTNQSPESLAPETSPCVR